MPHACQATSVDDLQSMCRYCAILWCCMSCPGSLLGWLQWMERAEHAFISNALVLAGGLTAWLVSTSLSKLRGAAARTASGVTCLLNMSRLLREPRIAGQLGTMQ